jgi:hypothetical protein
MEDTVPYEYPLKLSFKIMAVAPQIYIRDASGRDLFYVKQKLFKLKESISVFSDSTKQNQLYTIGADRILDFSAQYYFTSYASNQRIGSVKRQGMKSLWKASYMIFDANGQQTHHIKEDNPWVKVADGCLTGIPVLGMFSGYVFHPHYVVYQVGTETPVMRLSKKPAFLEGVFGIEKLVPFVASEDEETRLLLSFMMMLLLERQRG